jgi:hypothetical protein
LKLLKLVKFSPRIGIQNLLFKHKTCEREFREWLLLSSIPEMHLFVDVYVVQYKFSWKNTVL